MSWILGGLYCGLIWLVFAKLKLARLSLPIAIVLASVGPSLLLALLFCAQYFHPYTPAAIVLERIDPIIPQLSRPGRVTQIAVQPNVPLQKGQTLFSVDIEPYQNAVRRAEATLAASTQSVALAESSITLAEATATRAEADLVYAKNDRDRYEKLRASGGASQDEFERADTQFRQSKAAMDQAEERVTQSRLNVAVAQAKLNEADVSVEQAKYDLKQTTVTAPDDGYVTNMQLREGMMVGGGTGAVMTFIRDRDPDNQGIVVATFGEKNFLRIQPDQYAEVAMAAYPGEILTGRVVDVIGVSGNGQLTASGALPSALVSDKPTHYAVRIRLDNAESLRLPGGAQGQAAVYTQDVQIAGIPIMFLIRAKSWLNYLF